jgi:outer membrane protein assembly factor BamD
MRYRAAAFIGAVLVLASCASKYSDQRMLDEMGSLSKEEIMARGDALAAKKKYEDARRFYSFLADSFPSDPLGRQAALKVADTFFALKDKDSFTEAQLRYKDFASRFPNEPKRAYALVMLAKCSYQQRSGKGRDLAPIREAESSLKQMLQLFPNSPYTPEARELYAQCQEELARHELDVATYYANLHAWVGAEQRLDSLFATYPDTNAAKAGHELQAKIQARTKTVTQATKTPKKPTAGPTKH